MVNYFRSSLVEKDFFILKSTTMQVIIIAKSKKLWARPFELNLNFYSFANSNAHKS